MLIPNSATDFTFTEFFWEQIWEMVGEERKDQNCLVPMIKIRFSRAESTKF